MQLRDALARLTEERVDLSHGYILDLQAAVGWFHKANGAVDLAGLSAAHLRAMMRRIVSAGRSARTANNYRAAILRLWENALGWGWTSRPVPSAKECPRLREPRRMPTAWRPEQVNALVQSCRRQETRRGWSGRHWEALVMTIYDTSLRVGCLLAADVECVDERSRRLNIPGEFHKHRRDTSHVLHTDTVNLLLSLWRPRGSRALFPFPWHKRELWRKFRAIVEGAGLPATRRDLFHKLRRTSYTYVAVRHGVAAASRHAAHLDDLSRYYLDPTFLEAAPLEALPRPRAG